MKLIFIFSIMFSFNAFCATVTASTLIIAVPIANKPAITDIDKILALTHERANYQKILGLLSQQISPASAKRPAIAALLKTQSLQLVIEQEMVFAAASYKADFTQAELLKLREFYETSVGQKVVVHGEAMYVQSMSSPLGKFLAEISRKAANPEAR